MNRRLFFMVTLLIAFPMFHSCKKEENTNPNPNPVDSTIQLPILVTYYVFDLLDTSGTVIGANINFNGNGKIFRKGFCWNINPNPDTSLQTKIIDTSGSQTNFSYLLKGLNSNTKYYVRSFAVNKAGLAYGTETFFTTKKVIRLPTVSTINSIDQITDISALCRGNITSNGGGQINCRGICWSTSPNPTAHNNKNKSSEPFANVDGFSNVISGLSPSTTYHIRAYARNEAGTAYGNDVTFTTMPSGATNPIITNPNLNALYGSVSDADGNTYKTIAIRNQIWMAENLKVSKFRNGESVPYYADSAQWAANWNNGNNPNPTAASCSYNYDESHVPYYGKLYNWYAATDPRGLCPAGWHLPSSSEFDTLLAVAGSQDEKVRTLSSNASGYWMANETRTNASGFSAIPGGGMSSYGYSGGIRSSGTFWSSTTTPGPQKGYCGNYLVFYPSGSGIFVNSYYNAKTEGYSVRCVKD